MGEIKHNPALMAAVQDLYDKEVIKKDKDIVDKLGYSKGTVSGYINGTAKASEDFLNKFEEAFNIRLSDYSNGKTNPTPDPSKVLLTGAVPTLQDYINEIKAQRDMFYALLSSNLGNLQEGQRTLLAYQKAWVDQFAEKESRGDPDKKAEIMYRVNKLVDDILTDVSLSGTQTGIGTRSRG